MNAKGAKDREGSQRRTREGWTAKHAKKNKSGDTKKKQER